MRCLLNKNVAIRNKTNCDCIQNKGKDKHFSTSFYLIIPRCRFNVNIFANGVSYIDSSRGVYIRRWCEDVYDSRTRHRLQHSCECGLWFYLLDYNFILTKTVSKFRCRLTVFVHIFLGDISNPSTVVLNQRLNLSNIVGCSHFIQCINNVSIYITVR